MHLNIYIVNIGTVNSCPVIRKRNQNKKKANKNTSTIRIKQSLSIMNHLVVVFLLVVLFAYCLDNGVVYAHWISLVLFVCLRVICPYCESSHKVLIRMLE